MSHLLPYAFLQVSSAVQKASLNSVGRWEPCLPTCEVVLLLKDRVVIHNGMDEPLCKRPQIKVINLLSPSTVPR